ncbi:MAG: endonuclease [Ignavibacteriales bacterium]|nr:endonuclease [Ignavibacteriales bacterium]
MYPTDGYVNNRRSNYPFGIVGSATWTSTNGSKVGTNTYPGYTSTVLNRLMLTKVISQDR